MSAHTVVNRPMCCIQLLIQTGLSYDSVLHYLVSMLCCICSTSLVRLFPVLLLHFVWTKINFAFLFSKSSVPGMYNVWDRTGSGRLPSDSRNRHLIERTRSDVSAECVFGAKMSRALTGARTKASKWTWYITDTIGDAPSNELTRAPTLSAVYIKQYIT